MKVVNFISYYNNLDLKKLNKLRSLWEDRTNNSFTDRFPHIEDRPMSQEEWEDEGCPHTWKLLEVNGEYSVVVDTSYWMMFLFKNDEIISYGEHIIITENVVVMDKNHYEISKYIWR